MARIRYCAGEPSRPQYTTDPVSTQTSSSHGSQVLHSPEGKLTVDSDDDKAVSQPRSSSRVITTESDEEDLQPSPVARRNARTVAAVGTARPPVKKSRAKRMLGGLSQTDILTPESIADDDADDAYPRPTQRMSGLKVPDFDEKAVRRSGRREAKKPVVYNMRIHPQDHALPHRRANLDDSMTIADETDEAPYEADSHHDKSDIVRAKSDSDLEEIDEDDLEIISSTPRTTQPHPNATRRSTRASASKSVHYDMNVHPNDRDIGIRTGFKRKRQSRPVKQSKARPPITKPSDPDETASEDDVQSSASAGLPLLPDAQSTGRHDTHDDGDATAIVDLFGVQSHARITRDSSDKSNTAANVEEDIGSQLSNISLEELDEETLDSFTKTSSGDSSRTLEDKEEPQPASAASRKSVLPQYRRSNPDIQLSFSSMQVLTSQVDRAKTPDLDFSDMLSQSFNEHVLGREVRPQRVSDGSKTMSEGEEPADHAGASMPVEAVKRISKTRFAQ